MRRAVSIAFGRNGGHADRRGFRQPLFEVVIFRLALGQAESPAVIMDHDSDVIRVVEGRGAAIGTWHRRTAISVKRAAR
jgi:hypothetical protein